MSASPDAVVPVILGADLHARPAGQVARIAATFSAAVAVASGARSADGRSVLAVMGLGAQAGETVTVTASGPDAAEAAAAIAQVLTTAEAIAH
jgi:phosphotransferase system HPr (HPr) family protein